jgi:hypothetical protein
MNFLITVLFRPTFIFTVFMSLLKVIDERLSSQPSNNFETFEQNNNENLLKTENADEVSDSIKLEKKNVDKLELIRNCLHFYFVNLLRCVDVIVNKIGAGGFGSVYLCFNWKESNINLSVVKSIKLSDSIDSADREQQFGYLSKLDSPYLVKYRETFTFNNDLYVVMEYFEDGNLNDFIKRYREANQRIKEGVYFYFI